MPIQFYRDLFVSASTEFFIFEVLVRDYFFSEPYHAFGQFSLVEKDYVKQLVQLGVIFLGLMICDIVICCNY